MWRSKSEQEEEQAEEIRQKLHEEDNCWGGGRRRRRSRRNNVVQPWEISRGRASFDQMSIMREPIMKTLEIDTARPYSYSSNNSTPKTQKPQLMYSSSHHQQKKPAIETPSPSKPSRNPQIHTASPRCQPSMPETPNYIAATESAKARRGLRSQSAPRQRILNPADDQQRDKSRSSSNSSNIGYSSSSSSSSAKKRLSFPVVNVINYESVNGNGNESDCGSDFNKWRRPRYKGWCIDNSNGNNLIGVMEKRASVSSSCCTDSQIMESGDHLLRRRWN